MEITEVKVFLVNEEKLKAFVSIVIDRCFMINDIKVIQGREGLFISMPSRRKKNGEFKDVAHPLNNETRRWMEDQILAEYQDVLAAARGVDASDAVAHRVLPAKAPALSPAPQEPLPAVQQPSPAASTEPAAAAVAAEDAPKTLDEVQEQHLSDSFWSVSGG